METMMHFGHEHGLFLREKEEKHKTRCDICHRRIVGSAYECDPCDFSIHRSCAELPRESVHPFHPQHPLTLLAESPLQRFHCSACGKYRYGFTFHCFECQFDLDVACAALTPTTNYQDQVTNKVVLGHPHPLILCDHNNEKYFPFFCSVCNLRIEGSIYVCVECKRLLHETCTNLPEEIKHPFHPEHPLALLHRPPYDSGAFQCDACRIGSVGFTYNCSRCDFDLDIHCASLMPTSTQNYEPDDDHEHFNQPHPHPHPHPHPLIVCNKKTNFPHSCNACGLPLEDSIYVCIQCKNLLHKSCAELPQQLQHPFHRMHPLTLRRTAQRISCRACRNYTRGFAYCCFKCSFQVHTRCGWPIPLFINSESHKHPVAFFNNNIEAQRLLCNYCKKQCTSTTGFFGCVECNFNLHVHCYPKLPPTIKHKSHLHPLNLITNSPINDHPDEEFYCSVCEEKRHISDPTYYCAECHYIAHVHCVISEDLYLLGEEWSLASKLDDTKLDTPTDEVIRDIGGSSLPRLEELHTEVDAEEAS